MGQPAAAEKKGLREKVHALYDYAKDNVYLCLSDMDLGGEKYNSALLYGFLTACTGGKEVIFGEYGMGKTTSSENIIALYYGLPKEAVMAATLQGQPEQTEEKTVGRFDIGKLNRGDEETIWTYFVLLEPKLIDEVNRLPAGKQSVILQGMDRGVWKYGKSSIYQDVDFCLFGTCNYRDSGNTDLMEAVLDRFDIAVESRSPGTNLMRLIRHKKVSGKDVEDLELSDRLLSEIEKIDVKEFSDYSKVREKVEEISKEFREDFSESTGTEMLDPEERQKVKEEISSIKFDPEADLFLDLVIAEVGYCPTHGQKRANQSCRPYCNHYKNYAGSNTKRGLSVRTNKAITKYAKALAWFHGDEKVTVEHLQSVIPFSMWHKVEFYDDYVAKFRDHEKDEPMALYAAKQMVSSMKKEFDEIKGMQAKVVSLLREGKYEEAKDLVEGKTGPGLEQPVFQEYLRIE